MTALAAAIIRSAASTTIAACRLLRLVVLLPALAVFHVLAVLRLAVRIAAAAAILYLHYIIILLHTADIKCERREDRGYSRAADRTVALSIAACIG